jgi:hypothetical protein
MLLVHGDGRIPQPPSLTGRLETVKNRRRALQRWHPRTDPCRTATPRGWPANRFTVTGGPYSPDLDGRRCLTSITRPPRSAGRRAFSLIFSIIQQFADSGRPTQYGVAGSRDAVHQGSRRS